MTFLMYGSGSVGRGFIGSLFASAGYDVAFVDVNTAIIDALNTRHSYNVTVAADPLYDIPVTGVRGVDGTNEKAVINEIVNCDIMATSLGATVLQKVAPLIAKGFIRRIRENGRPLDLLICENLKDASNLLRVWLLDALPDEDKSLLDKLGLIEAAIGRMIPVAVPIAPKANEHPYNTINPIMQSNDDPLRVTVEEYAFLPVDTDAFVGEPPDIPGLVPYSPFSFYEERKLYLHNMSHAICAYLAMLNGFHTIAEAISDPSIRLLTQSAMTESAAMLSIKYSVPFNKIFDHAEDLLLRFGNAALGDTCERVGRDPIRKIAAGDRLAGALCQCQKHDVYPVYIALGYAAAIRNITDDEAQAEKAARETGGLNENQTRLVMKIFPMLGMSTNKLIKAIEQLKKDMRGNIV